MKTQMKKALQLLLVLCLVLLVPVSVYASGLGSAETTYVQTVAPETDLPDNDELFALYAEQQLYDAEYSTFGTQARAKLNQVEKAMYDALKPKIEAVAAGGGSTVFVLNEVAGLTTSWTNTELGVSYITNTDVSAAMNSQFNLTDLIAALVDDCPFELYWYDKTVGVRLNYSIGYSGPSQDQWTKATVSNLTFTFVVANDYASGENAVTTNVSKVSSAKAAAQAVVSENQGKNDYEKLIAYKEYICGAVAYNYDAAGSGYTGGYGNPWQLIYVFDGDSNTNVVCEGYAKAFQYLCDLSGIDCIPVDGEMNGGAHMWNVVTLDGANYLVDLTNCDEGTVGAPDKLFLVGGTYKQNSYSYTINSRSVLYTCDDLNLSAQDYTPPEPAPCTHEAFAGGACTTCGITGGYCGGEGDGTNLIWTLEDGTLTISGTGEMEDYDWYEYDTSSAPWTAFSEDIKSVRVQDDVTSVGVDAFWACEQVVDIELADSVTELADYSIYGCGQLTTVKIGRDLSFIGQQVFDECEKLINVDIHSQNPYYSSDDCGVIYNKEQSKLVRVPLSFTGKFVIPETVCEIMPDAFMHCEKITEIIIPNSVKVIGGGAFVGCWGLKSIEIPDGVSTIGDSTFSGCNITSVVIPASVTSIESYAFFMCEDLADVYYGGSYSQWKKISIYRDNEYLTNAPYIHYECNDVDGHWQKITVAANCQEYGYTEEICECGYVRNRVVSEDALGHNIVTDTGYAATCTETGLTDGEHCTRCDDATVKGETIPALGHDIVTDKGYAATCTETGLTDGEHCTRCDGATVKQETIVALGHDIVIDTGYAATCTEPGLTDGEHCTRCDDATVKQETIAALGHDIVIDTGYAATCTETGLTDGEHCTRCDDATVKQETIAALGHDIVTDKGYAATCTETGLTDGAHCTRCGTVTVQQETIAALGHNIVADTGYAVTCTETGLTDGEHCTRCDDATVAQKVLPALGHDIVNVKGTAATCTETGLTDGEHCIRCNEVITEQKVIAALGHNYKKGTCGICGEKDPTYQPGDPAEVLGDANGDGEVDTIDAMRILQYATYSIEGDELDMSACDVNGDGSVDTIDAMLVLQYATYLIDSFPNENAA